MNTPIKDMLAHYADSRPVRFHMPGHKGKTCPIDLTELSFTDDLRHPKTVILQSEKQVADVVGANFCHFSVNGSSAGLFAMAMCCNSALVERNCHVSLINALNVFGKTYSFFGDGTSPATLKSVQEAAAQGAFDAVFITSPDYFGRLAETQKIHEFLRSRNVKLFVDSAHGAHFGFSEYLPQNQAIFCDAAVQSCHKTLGSMTQTAVVFVGDEALSNQIKRNLNSLTTTSPSFVLLESIENAYVYVSANGNEHFARLRGFVENFKNRAAKLGFEFMRNDDFTRIVFDCSNLPYDGKELYAALEKQNVFCEFATDRYVVAISTLYDDEADFDKFSSALENVVVQEKTHFDYVAKCFATEEDL